VSVHVVSVAIEDLRDKPTTKDCNSEPCPWSRQTVKATVGKIHMVLSCEQWAVLGKPKLWSRCIPLEAGENYQAIRNGNALYFTAEPKAECGWSDNPCVDENGTKNIYSPYVIQKQTE
jgi:hypothetical protein